MIESKDFVGYLVMAVENSGIEGVRVRSYSGRGMYGESCVGVSVDNLGEFIQVVASATLIASENDDEDGFVQALGRMNSDSLGRGSIYYWPGVDWTADCAGAVDGDDE